MSGTTTPARDEQLLNVGTQCSAPHCHLVDFLPYTCAHCASPFCADHRTPTLHACAHYDAHAANRVAPECPMCGAVVAVAPGMDPNARMERHFAGECVAMTGKATPKGPVCAHKRCAKVLHAPIRCDTCAQQFCPQHRFPNTHACTLPLNAPARPASGPSRPSSAAVAAAVAAAKRQATAKAQQLAASASAATSRSSVVSRPASAPGAALPASAAKKASGLSNPFSATDRRARAERESQHRAMAARAARGLLSKEEKVIFAQEEAERAKAKAEGREGDCVIA